MSSTSSPGSTHPILESMCPKDIESERESKNRHMKEYVYRMIHMKMIKSRTGKKNETQTDEKIEVQNDEKENKAKTDKKNETQTDEMTEVKNDGTTRIIIKDGYPREVKLWSFITKVTAIDTKACSFDVFFTLSASWIETDPKENIKVSEEDLKSEKYRSWKRADFRWHPQLRFINTISEDTEFSNEWFRVVPCEDDKLIDPGINNGNFSEWREKHQHSDKSMKVTHFMKKKLTLSEVFELAHFPVDMQLLHIQISSSWDCHNVLLCFCDKNPSASEPQALDSQEFDLHHPRLIAYDTHSTDEDLPLLSDSNLSITGVRYSRAYIALVISRNPGYYLWNVSVMLLIIGTLSFTIFNIDIDLIDTRLGNLFTLVLAVVAFKLVLANGLPVLGYLTSLDRYILGTIMTLFIIGAGIAIIAIMDDINDQKWADRILFYVSSLIWVGVNVQFYFSTFRQLGKRKKTIKESNDKFRKLTNTIKKKGDYSLRHSMGRYKEVDKSDSHEDWASKFAELREKK